MSRDDEYVKLQRVLGVFPRAFSSIGNLLLYELVRVNERAASRYLVCSPVESASRGMHGILHSLVTR